MKKFNDSYGRKPRGVRGISIKLFEKLNYRIFDNPAFFSLKETKLQSSVIPATTLTESFGPAVNE